MPDYDRDREIERFLARAYEQFEHLVRIEYAQTTADQQLRMVRQFCRFLTREEGPRRHFDPPPPQP